MIIPVFVTTDGYLVKGYILEVVVDGYLLFQGVISTPSSGVPLENNNQGGSSGGGGRSRSRSKKSIFREDFEDVIIEEDDLILSVIQSFVRCQ